VSVAVGAGADGGVAGCCHGVGVVVVAVGEVGAALEEEVESVSCLEVVAVAFEVVSAELVEHENYNELGLGMVGVCARGYHPGHCSEKTQKDSGILLHGYKGNRILLPLR